MSDLFNNPILTGEVMWPGRVRLRIHGKQTSSGTDAPVTAAVFALKLGSVVRALRAADRAVNGKLTYDYEIKAMAMGSAIVDLQGMPLPNFTTRDMIGQSAVAAFGDCLTAINEGRTDEARRFGKCPNFVSKLAAGADKQFGYAELWVADKDPIRVDGFLTEQAEAVVAPQPAQPVARSVRPWFKGVSIGGFDGVVKSVDLRGSLPQVKLVLTAGGKELDCICRDVPMEEIRAALDRRVRVRGRVFYDGKTGFPRRIEASTISQVKSDVNFTRWRGAFEPFEVAEWTEAG